MRQLVLAQRDLDFHARVGVGAQHLDHARDGFPLRRRLLDDFDHDDIAGLGLAALLRRHQQILVDAPVFGDDERDAVLVVEAADDGAVGALEDVDDLSLGSAATVDAGLAHGDAIAVQRLVHLARIEEDVGAAVLGHQEAVAVRMTLHDAGDEIELGDDAKLALAVHQQLAVALHRRKPAGKGFARAAIDRHRPHQFVGGQGHAGVGQGFEDGHA